MKTFYIVEVKDKYSGKLCWEAYRDSLIIRLFGKFTIDDFVLGTISYESSEKCKYYLMNKLGGKEYRIIEKVKI